MDMKRIHTSRDASHQAGGSVPSAAWPKAGFALRLLDELVYWGAGVSILTGQSWRWIDLRFAGGSMQTFLPGLWLASLMALAVARRVDFPRRGPITPERLRRRLRWNRLLLLPSWLIMLVLFLNTVTYYEIWNQRDGDLAFFIPMCLPVLLVLAAWMGQWPGRILAAKPESLLPPPVKYCRLIPPHAWYDQAAEGCVILLMVWIFGFAFRSNPPPKNMRADLAVVFGNAVLPHDVCGRTMENRTLAAIGLYERRRVRYLMLSGRAPHGAGDPRQNETLAMYNLCRAAGVPARNLIKDFHGDNTRTSVYDAVNLMRRRRWKTVVAVSSDYHLPRIRLAFAQLGVRAWTAPSVSRQWRQTNPYALLRELVAYPVYLLDPDYHDPELKK